MAKATQTSVGMGEHGENLSIMIPTYNCASYLKETLLSLKAQGDILDQAHIEVVDDCSTKDDPEAAIREVWGERVAFHRQPQNGGAIKNFNSCIDRAQREWIHILHGDDFVLPLAYQEFAQCLRSCPQATTVFTRSLFIDKESFWMGVTPMLGSSNRGILEYSPEMWSSCPVQFAGILLSRSALNSVGRFNPNFCHAADWNLWWRIAKTEQVAFSNTCVGAYRIFEGNHSSTLKRSARNLAEYLQQVGNIAASVRETSGHNVETDHLYRFIYSDAINQCHQYIDDPSAFRANMRVLKRFPPAVRDKTTILKLRIKHLRRLVLGNRGSH